MTDYSDSLRRHRRIAILRHLEASVEYTSNAAILQDVLAGVGLPSTRDQVVTEIGWLVEQGFAKTHGDGFLVVAATLRGAEIARGIATHPEIQRPSPRD
jgi:hypothetical protein